MEKSELKINTPVYHTDHPEKGIGVIKKISKDNKRFTISFFYGEDEKWTSSKLSLLEEVTIEETLKIRRDIIDTFHFNISDDNILDNKMKKILSIIPRYKKVIEENKDKDLIYYDSGNDRYTDYTIAINKGEVLEKINDNTLESLLNEIFPKGEEELKYEKEERRNIRNIQKHIKQKKHEEKISVTSDGSPDLMKFGQYEGENILDVIEKDDHYIKWCTENVKWFPEYLDNVKNKYNIEI